MSDGENMMTKLVGFLACLFSNQTLIICVRKENCSATSSC